MIVLDASAVVDWLLQTPAGKRIEQHIYARKDTLHTVYLLDVEFAQVLRRLVREGRLARKRAEEAIEDLIALRVTRYAPVLFLDRIWQLRQNLSAYDAAYVALAEVLKAPLITRDQRIAAAPGHAATIEVFLRNAGGRIPIHLSSW
jgi:predicted nucleic acid-binding protein